MAKNKSTSRQAGSASTTLTSYTVLYTEVKRWTTGEDSILEPAEIKREIYMLVKKFMQDSRLMQTPGHKTLDTDIAYWKLHSDEYYNSRQDEWIRVYKCPLNHRCRCQAKVRIITEKNYKRLEFHGTHDENGHANDKSKSLRYNQIVAIHDAVQSSGRAESVCCCYATQSDASKGQSRAT